MNILVTLNSNYLNPLKVMLKSLYDIDLKDYLFAAAYHDRVSVRSINRLRLRPYDIEAYYNSGVLLFNLEPQRKIIHFCGKQKPWKKYYSGKFHSLYKHYERIALG